MAQHPSLLALFNRTQVCSLVESAVGPIHSPRNAQIATRYPGFGTPASDENYAVNYHFGNWERHWHIDGLHVPNRPPNGVEPVRT